MKKPNQLVAGYANQGTGMDFIDVFDSLAGLDGRQRPELYAADKMCAELPKPYVEQFKTTTSPTI